MRPAVAPSTDRQGLRWLLLGTMALWGLNLPVMKLLLPVFGTLGTPVLRMARTCIANSCSLPSAAIKASVIRWRARRSNPSRDHTLPHAYSVMRR